MYSLSQSLTLSGIFFNDPQNSFLLSPIQVGRTQVLFATLVPQWRASFEIPLEPKDALSAELTVDVYDFDEVLGRSIGGEGVGFDRRFRINWP